MLTFTCLLMSCNLDRSCVAVEMDRQHGRSYASVAKAPPGQQLAVAAACNSGSHSQPQPQSQQLPGGVLHRFPGKPCPKDVDVYIKEGVQWVGLALKGVSFLQIDSDNGLIHGRFHGPCFLTAPL